MVDTVALKNRMMEVAEQYLGQGKKMGDHLSYACPFVAEKTPGAFCVYEDHYFCYSCGASGDVIKFVQQMDRVDFREACRRLGAGETDNEAIEAWRQKREAERAAEEVERQKMRQSYHDSGKWKEYHLALDSASRERWRKWGIPDSFQNWWKLGYTPDRTYSTDNGLAHSEAFVMPMWSFPNGVPSHVLTSQFRLTNPAPGAGRFRFEMGLGTAAFITRNDWKSGETDHTPYRCLVVEGPRKAATVRCAKGIDANLQIVGVPSKLDTGGILEALKRFEWVFVWLDPDVRFPPKNAPSNWEPADVKLCKAIGGSSSYVRFGYKIDDAILAGQLDGSQIQRMLMQAERVL